MAQLALIRATIGLSSQYHDHYMRAHSLNLSGDDTNQLLGARLGNTSLVAPSEMNNIAARSGGVATQASGVAGIEDGWQTSRGLASFEFAINGASPVQAQTLTVYGYMYGGSPADTGGALPADAMFVPVRMWMVETAVATDHTGFPQESRMMSQSGTYLLNDPNSMGNPNNGLHTIRPVDVINSASAFAAFDDDEQPSGMLDGFGGSSTGMLQTAGMNISKSNNQSTVDYANKILTAAATASFENEKRQDRYEAISMATGLSSIREVSLEDNPFIRVMRRELGYVNMANFVGFSMSEIATVFENFYQVTNAQLTDVSSFDVADHRYSSNAMGGSTFETLVCSELNNIANAILDGHRLSYLSIRATNDVQQGMGQIVINGLPVLYQMGESAPMVDKDPDWQYLATQATETLLAQFYTKYNAEMIHDRMIVDFEANLSLFGESTITVTLHGNRENPHKETFGTMAGNRFDPSLVTSQGLNQSVGAFYNNLKEYMNF
ncbi:hypothetical protein HWC35_gp115 [Vibrio phage USC-1]|uniref:Uncharacterized protein n=2 Tax=Aphroditevirus USC1 TaxID=2846605 RepID=A0A514A2M3_9CAUD|nr:hypothetical protein HWC35_gp115 [Vibrio phage USC-1]QCW23219.1 hypothetical protein [Vibrio phage 5 TSL-2019]QDH47509.1 hypothetical protein [Vibrio phage USC-1]